MGDHSSTVVVPPIWYVWQRALRTALQVAVALVLALGGSVGLLQALSPQVLAAVVDVLPPNAYAWLVAAFAFVIAIATALSRLMAIPLVNAWLTRVHAGSVPKIAATDPAATTTAGYPDALKSEPEDALG
ncbi:hypothetical protein HUN59_04595 [Curtobacterium sp. Csp2]|uniref:hypothetical protein n=1 Tax=Curtobacterium sp. Csp2 TaxID=2495430 RepID=UPI001580B4DE|nr:hypothetical protein [Curtobacterium sp. Csp2]QKS15590.1 hypothetical protein HUN59_04595 [Curtobacterium sp. Csp2]